MVTQERIDTLIKEIFAKPLPPKKKKRYKRRSITLPDNWEEIRLYVYWRDLVCVECGSLGQGVHHIDEDRTNNNFSNLIYLCWSCHRKHHHRNGQYLELV